MTDNQGLSPTEVEALYTETFTTHSSSTPLQVTDTIEQKFDSFVPYITEVMHHQKRSQYPKVLKMTTDHKRVWKYLRDREEEIDTKLPDGSVETTKGLIFDLGCAARALGMDLQPLNAIIDSLDKAGWLECIKLGATTLGKFRLTLHEVDHIVAMCTITYALPTTLTMDVLRDTRMLH